MFKDAKITKAESLVENWQGRISVVEQFDPSLSWEKKIVLAQCLGHKRSK